jgi:hypothetical protein
MPRRKAVPFPELAGCTEAEASQRFYRYVRERYGAIGPEEIKLAQTDLARAAAESRGVQLDTLDTPGTTPDSQVTFPPGWLTRTEEALLKLRPDSPNLATQVALVDAVVTIQQALASPADAPTGYVTLRQMAAIVNKSPRTLERYKARQPNPLPDPDVPGGGGRADEWLWAHVRPWLEQQFRRRLPERFPAHIG